jgi:hypothetical protein
MTRYRVSVETQTLGGTSEWSTLPRQSGRRDDPTAAVRDMAEIKTLTAF